jgi:hypothetical protein
MNFINCPPPCTACQTLMDVDELLEPERERAEGSKPERERADGNKLKPEHVRTDGTELEPEPSETEGADGTALPLECKWLLRRKKRIGRQKDGRQVKPGTYNLQGACESLGLAPSAPPQQMISAVMIDQDAQHSASVPLKAELQRELTKALACNAKNAATIECLQKQNKTMKTTISLQKTETKLLVEDRRQLRREKMALVKAYETRFVKICSAKEGFYPGFLNSQN